MYNRLGPSFPFYMGMLFLIWKEVGMGKFPHSWLSSHSETEFLHSRLRRSWRNTLSLFLLSHSWGNFFSRLRGFATQGGKIPSLILSRWEIAHFPRFVSNFTTYKSREMYLFRMRQFEELTFSQHKLIHFHTSRVAEGHEWLGNELTSAEKKLIPRIASSRKGIL